MVVMLFDGGSHGGRVGGSDVIHDVRQSVGHNCADRRIGRVAAAAPAAVLSAKYPRGRRARCCRHRQHSVKPTVFQAVLGSEAIPANHQNIIFGGNLQFWIYIIRVYEL